MKHPPGPLNIEETAVLVRCERIKPKMTRLTTLRKKDMIKAMRQTNKLLRVYEWPVVLTNKIYKQKKLNKSE